MGWVARLGAGLEVVLGAIPIDDGGPPLTFAALRDVVGAVDVTARGDAVAGVDVRALVDEVTWFATVAAAADDVTDAVVLGAGELDGNG